MAKMNTFRLRPVFTWIWVALGAAAFVTEMVALFNRKDGDTLSEQMWKLLRVEDARPSTAVWVGRGLVALFLLWLVPHFLFGWFTPSHPLP